MPQSVIDKLQEGLEKKEGTEKLWEAYKREVMMEQELATSEESLKVKDFMRQRESEINQSIQIKDWGLFTVGI